MSTISEVIGLGIGEETKGAWVEFLVHQTKAHHVWRKGGPQSGHHLVIDDQTQAMLSHFGAGVFQGIPTYIDMPIIPVDLFREAQTLSQAGIPNPLSLITINASCLVVTPFHQTMSRLREILKKNKKGTVGLGVGEAIRNAKKHPELTILAHHLRNSQSELEEVLDQVRLHCLNNAYELTSHLTEISKDAQVEIAHLENLDLTIEIAQSYNFLADLVNISYEGFLDEVISHNVVIETSHGAQLHPRYGYFPHVTQIDPVGQDALKRLRSHQFTGILRRFGVFRSYSTRFGAGPLVVFDEAVTQTEAEVHHKDDPWLGKFRKGHLDLVGIAYGIKVCEDPKLSGLMISYLDSLRGKDSWSVCTAYQYHGTETNLSPYFEVNSGLITAIKLHPDNGQDTHLEHQKKLTQLLWDCTPVLESISPKTGDNLEEAFLKFVENYLGLPVVAVAHGPHLKDRDIRPGHEYLFS